MEKNVKSRLLSYDAIRIAAIILVLLVHVSAYIVLLDTDPESQNFFLGNIINGISRAGVPLFVMLSGALLLNESRPFDTKKFYKKSLLWMCLLLVGWLVVYAVFYAVPVQLLHGNQPSVSVFWDYIVTLSPSDCPHMWYMFMVVGMYLMIPVLRLFVKRENRNYIKGFIITAIVVQFLATTLNIFTKDCSFTVTMFMNKFHLEPATGYCGYLLTGWYLTNFEFKKKSRIIIYTAALVTLIGATVEVRKGIGEFGDIRACLFDQMSLPAFIYGVGTFLLIYSLCGERRTNGRIISGMSKYSFGVYMIHIVFQEVFTALVPYETFPVQNAMLYMAILFAVEISLSYAVVWLTSFVPGLRKIFYIK